jgi:hypothetical protein
MTGNSSMSRVVSWLYLYSLIGMVGGRKKYYKYVGSLLNKLQYKSKGK